MSIEEFNKKYKNYLCPGYPGLQIEDEEIIKYLDSLFETYLIKVERFIYYQIKANLSLNFVRFYSSLDEENDIKSALLIALIENQIKACINLKKLESKIQTLIDNKHMTTTIYALTHSSNIEEVKKLVPDIIVLPEAGLGPYEERELIHKLIGKTFCTFSSVLVNQIGNLIYKGIYKNTDFKIYTADCIISSKDVSDCTFYGFKLAEYNEEGYLCNGWPIGYFDPGIK